MHTTTLHGRDWSAELLEHLKRVTAELESVWKHLGQTNPNSHAAQALELISRVESEDDQRMELLCECLRRSPQDVDDFLFRAQATLPPARLLGTKAWVATFDTLAHARAQIRAQPPHWRAGARSDA